MEKGLSSDHEIPSDERREQDLEETDQKKDKNEEDEDKAIEEKKPSEVEKEDKEDDDGDERDEEEDSNSGDQSDEFMEIDLEEIRRQVKCPICLGIINKTRTMMKCLHRFCGKCIEKSLRLGNNECPTCRAHCPSRRSLRDDPNFDAFIAILFPNIDSYEEEELNEKEKARTKEIQESIAQLSERRKRNKGSKSRGME